MAARFKFTKAIKNTPLLNNCLKSALTALGKNANKININSGNCIGSVDIDGCLQASLPNDPRWDYAFSIYIKRGNEQFYYVEVHRGEIDEVNKVIDKFNWLLEWIGQNSPDLSQSIDEAEYYWITTGGNSVLPNTIEARRLAELGLTIVSSLNI